MPTIEFTHRDANSRGHPATGALARAAVAALRAPSILDSRPWRWHLAGSAAELRLDRDRLPRHVDPDGRLLTISCGAALHHACTALAGAGVLTEVVRFPDPADPDLLARLRVTGFAPPGPMAVRQQQAMALRRTDGQMLADVDLPAAGLDRLRGAAEAHGAHLDVLRRRLMEPADRHATYASLVVDADTPAGWLAAGEALSAVLLTATTDRLAVSPVIGPPEPPVRTGHAMLTLRLGVPAEAKRPERGDTVATIDSSDLERR